MKPRTAPRRLKCTAHYVPDIVITDWAMPIFDGIELAQMIRQPDSKGNPYAPIIMLTGHSEKRRVTVARDAGVTEFLAKPISAKGLYQRILNVVANPRPFIKTKTYFGPGPAPQHQLPPISARSAAPAAKMEVMQQPSLLDKARSGDLGAGLKGTDHVERTSPAILEIKAFADPSRHHAAEPAAQGACGGCRMTDRDDPVARAEKALKRTCRASSRTGWSSRPTACPMPATRSCRDGFTDDEPRRAVPRRA